MGICWLPVSVNMYNWICPVGAAASDVPSAGKNHACLSRKTLIEAFEGPY